MNKNLISTAEAAALLGISRVAIFKRIKNGKIKATKVGRNYVVDKTSLSPAFGETSQTKKHDIEKAVDKVFADFGSALKKLGSE